jgi:hypothetical protein
VYNKDVATGSAIRVRTLCSCSSTEKDGELTASIDGDDFQGVKGVPLLRPQATDYRPKWGLYRGVDKDMPLGDDYVDHKSASAKKL